MKACGTVHKYGDNVDTDVIIPARYLNSSDPAELAKSCMDDIDPDFVNRVKKGDIMVANKNFGAVIQRCMTDRDQGFPGQLRYCRDICAYLLQKCH